MRKDISILTLSALGTLPFVQMNAQQTNLPNVIYMMADDLGIGDLGCYGQKIIRTPNIDNLAANGIRFTQHYCGAPVSAPSRCSLLTGKHIGHAYIRGNKAVNISGETYDQPLADEEVTLGEIFKQKDYVTACIGKWGLGGPTSEGHPNRQGFDYFYGYLGQGYAHKYYPEFLHENEEKVMLNGNYYTHDLIVDKTLDFIEKNADKPFFIYFAPTIPHAELRVPDGELGEYEEMFQETPFAGAGNYGAQEKPKASFAAMITRLDRDVKRIMDLLEEKGIAENTLIIFTSDNGAHQEGGADPSFFNSTAGFRGIKRDLYEGGVRAPYIVHWPAKIKEARVSYHPSAFWDFMPTMCELIGVEEPEGIDGISFLPEITGEGIPEVHDHFYWEFHEAGGRRSVLKGDWKLIDLSVNNVNNRKQELYNIADDPGESSNKLSANPELVEELWALLESSRTRSGIWDFADYETIEGLEILTVTGAEASSFENANNNIAKSYDSNFNSIYHSKYSETYFPVILTYTFSPSDISTIIYNTRIDASDNGNFKEFEIWALPNGASEYIKIGSYDFKGVKGKHRLDFEGEEAEKLKNVKGIQFMIQPGVGGHVSCAEMTFYGVAGLGFEQFPGLELVEIKSAHASSVQGANVDITKSYDRDFSTNYHSNYTNTADDYFPIILTYNFDVATIQTVIYHTRIDDNNNGNFKVVELWALPGTNHEEDFVYVGEYDFQGLHGSHRIDFEGEIADKGRGIKALRFVVKSGAGNRSGFASCAEMAFYKKERRIEEKVNGVEKVEITNAYASSFQPEPDRGIKYSYDGDFTTNYHSLWGDYTFPIFLDYEFEAKDVKHIFYHTRISDGTNGNFKEVRFHSLSAETNEYVELGEYNFYGALGEHWVDLTKIPEQEEKAKNSKGIRFEILSGMANYASCAEVALYGIKPTITNVEEIHRNLPLWIVRDRRIYSLEEVSFEVYTLEGNKVDPSTSLFPGVYIVKANEQVQKVAVW